MHRDDRVGLELLLDGEGGRLRVLGVGPAARVEQDYVRPVELLDQGHVAEYPGIPV